MKRLLIWSVFACACASDPATVGSPSPQDDDEGVEGDRDPKDGGKPDARVDSGRDTESRDAGRKDAKAPPPPPPVVEERNCNDDIDVVFVVDVSGSMVPALSKLMAEVDRVDEALRAKDLPSPPHYGLVAFVDDVVVANGGAPYADIDAFKAAVNNEITTTQLAPWRQATGAPELNLSWPENSLDALYAAATSFEWRPAETTHRTIIHITDASFWDGTEVSSAAGDPMMLEPPGGCSVAIGLPLGGLCTIVSSQHSYTETIEALRAGEIWANTFAARTGGPPGLTPPPPSHGAFRGVEVNVGIGFHEEYNGNPSIASSSGGLSWDVDEVFDGVISLATPINEAIASTECMDYPMPI